MTKKVLCLLEHFILHSLLDISTFDDECMAFLRNVEIRLTSDTASCTRRTGSSAAQVAKYLCDQTLLYKKTKVFHVAQRTVLAGV